ncbi:MAG: hypothetical protein CL606_03680 [Anaerolineaceae bacterium]|nr:hypothetical protein [Anaerolineaceae bacterium]|tara:strand:- start:19066 stop:19755 length:690 start_codon:yes stop_codon:yes gene_type:complete
MFNNLDRKENVTTTTSLDVKDDNTVFRPLSPFSAKEAHKKQHLLPGWILPEGQSSKSPGPNNYDFEWLKNSKTIHNKSNETSVIANAIDNSQAIKPTNNNQYNISSNDKSQQAANDPDQPNQTHSSSVGTSDSANTGSNKIVDSGSATEILRNARSMSRDGNLDEAMGNYISLVKSAKKLKQVVDDLEKLVSDPHIEQKPAMIQTLADAYTKTGKFAKALPLYRKALGR